MISDIVLQDLVCNVKVAKNNPGLKIYWPASRFSSIFGLEIATNGNQIIFNLLKTSALLALLTGISLPFINNMFSRMSSILWGFTM